MANSQTIVGNIGTDPELREVGDKVVCNIRVATREYNDETEWHSVTIWGKSAEYVCKYGNKGDVIYVEGRTRTEKFEVKGEPREKKVINANRVELYGKRGGNDNEEAF